MYCTFKRGDWKFNSHDGVPNLEEMQAVVGGYIEPIDLWEDEDGSVTLYVNEEGLYKCEPSLSVRNTRYHGDPLVRGDVVVVRTDFTDGETVSLKKEDLDRLTFLPGQFAFLTEDLDAPRMPILQL
jgi:hypothetical protein